MTKAYGYLRVSGAGQVEGEGFERQEQAVRAYANSQELKITKVFREQVSGARDMSERDMLQDIKLEMTKNGAKTLVVESFSRLSRDLVQQELFIKDMEACGLSVASATELDAGGDADTRRMIRCILGAFWEYDKRRLVEKLRIARAQVKKREGRCEGPKPFGSRPGEADILKRMRELRNQGLGYHKIAQTLKAGAVKARKGNWRASTVRVILLRQEGE